MVPGLCPDWLESIVLCFGIYLRVDVPRCERDPAWHMESPMWRTNPVAAKTWERFKTNWVESFGPLWFSSVERFLRHHRRASKKCALIFCSRCWDCLRSLSLALFLGQQFECDELMSNLCYHHILLSFLSSTPTQVVLDFSQLLRNQMALGLLVVSSTDQSRISPPFDRWTHIHNNQLTFSAHLKEQCALT